MHAMYMRCAWDMHGMCIHGRDDPRVSLPYRYLQHLRSYLQVSKRAATEYLSERDHLWRNLLNEEKASCTEN